MSEAAEELEEGVEETQLTDETEPSEVQDDDQKAEEPWQKQETDEDLADVPVHTHIRMKTKLKGRLANEKDRVAQLEAEVEALKSGTNQPTPAATNEMPVLPKRADFADDAEFDVAYDKYRDDKDTWNQNRNSFQSEQVQRQETFAKQITEATESHYERAAQLVSETGISPEVYQQADKNVRTAFDSVAPGRGDVIADQMISVLGKDSEKVLYFVGNPNNPNALNTARSLLAEDPSGLKLAAYLGSEKTRLTKPKKQISSAPPPAAIADGDGNVTESAKIRKLKENFNTATKKGNLQKAYNLKKEAKQLKADVSKW